MGFHPTALRQPVESTTTMIPNIYVYKCVVDDGTAPCTDRSLLSMTVCKPKVRTSAKVGDVVIAFGTNAQPAPNRLVLRGQERRRICRH
jgi:Nucleotide modification associated domain 2